jgi:shikimate kinase
VSTVQNVVLIAPTGSGKTAVAPVLAERLAVPLVELDDVRWRYYSEIGYSEDEAARVQETKGIDGLLEYWKPFELQSVQRLLQDYPTDHVLAFGGGQSVYTSQQAVEQASEALATSRVVLLLPSEDVELSVAILVDRIRNAAPELPEALMPSVQKMAREQHLSVSNRSLADCVIYNGDLSVSETVDAVLNALECTDR